MRRERRCSNASRAVSFSIDVSAKEVSKLPVCGKNVHTALSECGRRLDKEQKMGILMDFEGERGTSNMQWADNFWIISLSKENLEQMLRDLIEEASRGDLVPEAASLWWTSTDDSEERCDISIYTTFGCHKFPLKEKFKILGYSMNRQGKSHDAMEERMQSAKKAFWEVF